MTKENTYTEHNCDSTPQLLESESQLNNKSNCGRREGALEDGMKQVKSRYQWKATVGNTKLVMMEGGARSRRSQVGNQSPARMQAHGGVKRARSHGGYALDDTLGMSDGDGAAGGGDLCGAEQTDSQGDNKALEGKGGADSSCERGGDHLGTPSMFGSG